MRRRLPYLVATAAVVALLGAAAWVWRDEAPSPEELAAAAPVDREPRLRPDYTGVTLPPNIAPMNIVIDEPGTDYFVRLRGAAPEPLEVRSRTPEIVFPPRAWRRFLAANRGPVQIEVYARAEDGAWRQFRTITNTVAEEPIDGYLVYRLIKPLHNAYVNVGIYQRRLDGFEEREVLKNTRFDRGCVNCHTFLRGEPSSMVLHTRGPHGPAMLLAQGGKLAKIDTRTSFNPGPAAYSSWHPSGRLIAFSVNQLSLFFHTVGETRDVFDAGSDLAVYLVDSGTVTTVPGISQPDRNETWPAWSADGRYLYFCAAPKLPKERFREVKYDLMRIRYDADAGTWGEPETVLAAKDTGLSILEPRCSPDGRWLLFCMCQYGNFPVYQESSDLYLMDLATRKYQRLACNSDRCDSYHSWSSNSRWIVFSSKRADGVFARPHVAYIDERGEARKPFVLPQEDPTFYDSCIRTYNAPEFTVAPVPVAPQEFGRVLREPAPAEQRKALLDPRVPTSTAPAPPPVREPDSPYETRNPGG
jgi:Tol biopolymer transport system component